MTFLRTKNSVIAMFATVVYGSRGAAARAVEQSNSRAVDQTNAEPSGVTPLGILEPISLDSRATACGSNGARPVLA
jgi:hypothetical protein